MAPTGRPEIRRLQRVPNGARTYWVGLGRPTAEQIADDDFTCPEVTRRYVNRAALVAAIDNGSAFLSIEVANG